MIKVTIRELAKARGIKNAYQFGQDVGFSDRVALRIWNNEQLPKLKTLDKICAAWGCKLEDLVVYRRDGSRNGQSLGPPPPKQRTSKRVAVVRKTTDVKLSVSKRSR